MKRTIVITLIFVLTFNLCSCGTEGIKGEEGKETAPPQEAFTEAEVALESKTEEGNFPIKAANAYECIRTDTPIKDSGLVYAEAVNDMLHVFIQQRTDEGECFYEYCAYDMLEGKWTEPEKCSWNENLFKIADYAQAFHMGKDGNWYCMAKRSKEGKINDSDDYICRLNGDGSVETFDLPEEVYGEDDNMYNYDFVGDDTIMIVFTAKGAGPPNIQKTCLVNMKTNEYEILSINPGQVIPMVIGDEFFSVSYTEDFCGFLIRNKESAQPKREQRCEVFGTIPDSATPFFRWPQISQDEGDNVYLMYDDGIYGGYYTDKKLGTIVNENMAPFMKLQQKDGKTPMICSFDRGADMAKTDFYVLIGNMEESISVVKGDYELAHIRAAGE